MRTPERASAASPTPCGWPAAATPAFDLCPHTAHAPVAGGPCRHVGLQHRALSLHAGGNRRLHQESRGRASCLDGGTGVTPNQAYSDPSKAEHARQVMQAQRNAPPRPMLSVGDRVRVRVKPKKNPGSPKLLGPSKPTKSRA